MTVSIIRQSAPGATSTTRCEDETGLILDAAQIVNPAFDSEVTEYPVESGADHVDHVRPRPVVLQLEGVVSDTPIGSTVSTDPNEVRRSVEALAFLLETRKMRALVTVRTPELDYRNMALEGLQVRQDPNTGDALFFTATLKQVLIVTNERATVRVSSPRGKKKVNLGNKASTPTESPFLWLTSDNTQQQSRAVPYDAQSRRPNWSAPVPGQTQSFAQTQSFRDR
jgi:hypothetical protein